MKTLLQRILACLAIAAAALAGIPAMAEVISYKAELKGSNAVPPNKTTGTGSISAGYDTADKKLSWKGNYSSLTGPVTAAHFHGPAAMGRNAGIAVGIATGNLPASFEGSATLTDAQAADLMAGRWYFNLHTAGNPAGEIRGQVVK